MPQLDAIRETARSDLCNVLDSMPGDKVLILDDQIIGPLGLVAPSALLKEHGVCKVFKLSDKTFDTSISNVLYIVRPRMHLMKWIANQIKYWNIQKQNLEKKSGITSNDKNSERKKVSTSSEEEFGVPTNFSVFLVPRKTLICEKILTELGVYGDLTIEEFPLDLIVFDPYILSMEISTSFKECTIDGDFSSLYYVARSIMKLQTYYGLIPNVKYIGGNAKHVYDMMMRMKKQVGSQVFSVVPEINTLILLDRNIDLITPMLTQLTYEGLIDEVLGGIKNSLFETDKAPEAKGAKKKVLLNSSDRVFDRVRHLNQQHVAIGLQEKAKEIDEKMKEKEEIKQSIEKIKKFTKELPILQEDKKNLEMHINIMQQLRGIIGKIPFRRSIQIQMGLLEDDEKGVLDYIEECIDRQQPLVNVLRIICLYSLINGGIKTKNYDFIRKEIIQSYGLESMLTLNNLEKVGMLKRYDGKTNWGVLKKQLNLFDEKVMEKPEEEAMSDPHVVYNGYCPITVALVDQAVNDERGWKKIETTLNNISSKYGEEVQKGSQETQLGKKVVLVYFIGGVTFSELAAISYLNERSNDCEFIVATTKLINGSSFIEALMDDCGNGFKRRAMNHPGLLGEAIRIDSPNNSPSVDQ
ncbi:hypothetical protein ABK040_006406 [Willaertia magna]